MKEMLQKKVERIHDVLISKIQTTNDIGVHNGLAGIALFLFNYSKFYNGDEKIKKWGSIALEKSMEKINAGYSNTSFCSGIAGYAWVLDHLESKKFIELGCDELLPNFDKYLNDIMVIDMENGYYDFLHGGIGYAYYFLYRFANTNDKGLKKKYQEYLFKFLTLLEKTAIVESPNKIKWLSQMPQTNQSVYNLGLSHGISSIIGILTKFCNYEVFYPKSKSLLERAVNYVLSTKNNDETSIYSFPKFVPSNGQPKYVGRLAWCYSDLGIGVSLLHASKKLKDKTLFKTAISVLKNMASLRTQEEHCVVDAGICHGSFGNAHIFKKMGLQTKETALITASKYWMNDGLKKGAHIDGYAGFHKWNTAERKWTVETSLLEGISGIGLVILDYIENCESSWDESLMIS